MARVKNNKAREMAEGSKGAKQQLVTAARRGPPSKRTPELENEILMRIATGEAMIDVTAEKGMPNRQTIYEWMKSDPAFYTAIKDALEFQAYYRVEMMENIARGGQHSTGNVERDKLLVGVHKWAASKHNRTQYGENIKVDHAVEQTVINLPAEFSGMFTNPQSLSGPTIEADYQKDPSKKQ